MADNVIDSLLVRLGLDTDRQSFDQANSQFNAVRKSAMDFAGTIGAGLGFKSLTTDAADANDKLGLLSKRLGVSTKDLDSFQYALQRSGGEAGNAAGLLESANQALDQFQLGNSGSLDLASQWGLDAKGLMDSTNALEFMLNLADQIEGKSTQSQRNILEAFGLGGEGVFNMMSGGRNGIQELLDQSQELAPTIKEMAQNSREFNEAMVDLQRSILGITNIMSNELLPQLTEFAGIASSFISENRDTIASARTGFKEEGNAWLRDNWGVVGDFLSRDVGDVASDAWGALTGGSAADKTPSTAMDAGERRIEVGTPVDSNPPETNDREAWRQAVTQAEKEIGAPEGLLWAQLGQESSYNPNAVSSAGAKGLAQIMPDTERSLEKRFGRDLDPFNPQDAILMQKELMRENYAASGDWDEALRMYHGGWSKENWGPVNADYAPSIRERMGGGSTTNQNVTVNLNAVNDPDANARAIKRILSETADRARQDTRNEVY